MIDLTRLDPKLLSTEPFEWAFVGGLFEPQDAAALAAFFPRDNFKTFRNYDGEKDYAYQARELIGMGAGAPSHVESLSPAWRRLADALLSPAYRAALARLVGRGLDALLMEANIFHYGPGARLGPHVDHPEKLITHVFYFNEAWDSRDGGCLTILRSPNIFSEVFSVAPVVGNSVVLVRSGKSWHAVTPVVKDCAGSRLSLTVSFHSAGALSTLWPPGDRTPLRPYDRMAHADPADGMPGPLTRLRRRAAYLVRATARDKLRLTK